jgi:hypothetical protein
MNREQWTLLALDFAGSPGLSPAQLQKSLFLLGQELPTKVGDFYRFIAYDYGPFCADIYNDARGMESRGLVLISARPVGHREYGVTNAGHEEAKRLNLSADPVAIKYLSTVVEWVKSISFADLVRCIYAKYPEYKTNSLFRV